MDIDELPTHGCYESVKVAIAARCPFLIYNVELATFETSKANITFVIYIICIYIFVNINSDTHNNI
uniref:Uncharacterized protein n=1 Tax=viral metagenome TaxID=1070528 RepID=A0A6C0LG14_9ZZZZ